MPMELIYNGTKYNATDDSIFSELIFVCDSVDDALRLVNDLADMSEYDFDGKHFTGMLVRKRAVVLEKSLVYAKVYLRKLTDAELVTAELNTLKAAVATIPQKTLAKNDVLLNATKGVT